jgi:Fe-S oxidoreductase
MRIGAVIESADRILDPDPGCRWKIEAARSEAGDTVVTENSRRARHVLQARKSH